MIVFEHADVLDTHAGQLLSGRFVTVRDGLISEISDSPPDAAATAGARRVDARG